jgi:hypothetical protein
MRGWRGKMRRRRRGGGVGRQRGAERRETSATNDTEYQKRGRAETAQHPAPTGERERARPNVEYIQTRPRWYEVMRETCSVVRCEQRAFRGRGASNKGVPCPTQGNLAFRTTGSARPN